jgi:hypothetical protein
LWILLLLLGDLADDWFTVGLLIVASLNNAFILGYPGLIMVYLGWTAGVLCFVGGAAISFYNNCLLGELHETGGKRHVRYRDLAGHIYGTNCTLHKLLFWHEISFGFWADNYKP